MATWGKHKQCTCEVKHVAVVLEWAVEGYCGIDVLGQEQRAELAEAVHKPACDLAATRLDEMTGSIGVDISGVDAEVRLLRADLESVKEDLQLRRTELAAVQAEANRVSLAITGVKQDLDHEGRTCKTLESDVKELRDQLRAAHEVQRVPEEVSRFLATTVEVQLQQPEITGLAVPVAFTLHVPVQRDGEC
jgi:septal ring factor EnvC (AmiA/AmiB activator)